MKMTKEKPKFTEEEVKKFLAEGMPDDLKDGDEIVVEGETCEVIKVNVRELAERAAKQKAMQEELEHLYKSTRPDYHKGLPSYDKEMEVEDRDLRIKKLLDFYGMRSY